MAASQRGACEGPSYLASSTEIHETIMLEHLPILLTNDDGFDAAGMQALAAALEAKTGEAPYIVAPNRCYSGASQQVTMSAPIQVERRGPRAWSIDAAPADCARIGITQLAPDCRLVLSGINHGGNLGHDIYVSGTVGAAREAALLGVNAVAVSHYFRPGVAVDWARAADWAMAALATLSWETEDNACLWNINLPHFEGALDATPPIQRCSPCNRALPIAYTLKDGAYFYDGSRYHTRSQEPGTDVAVCFGGSIAVSALPAAFHTP